MTSRGAFRLISEQPCLPIFAQSQKLSSFAKFVTGQIVERIHLVGARGHQPKVCGSQLPSECPQVLHPEFDFNFFLGPPLDEHMGWTWGDVSDGCVLPAPSG